MALFAATLPTRRPFKLHTVPPHPPSVGNTHRGARTVADHNGGGHLPSARRKRRTCQRSCRHSCSAGPKLCGPRRRDRGGVSKGAKCPPRHETRRQTCTLRAQSGDRNEPAHGKKKREWLCIEWVTKRYSDYNVQPPHNSSMAVGGWFDCRSCPRLMTIEILRLYENNCVLDFMCETVRQRPFADIYRRHAGIPSHGLQLRTGLRPVTDHWSSGTHLSAGLKSWRHSKKPSAGL